LSMVSACESHLALPSFSVMEPSRRKTWVTTILETEDWGEEAEGGRDAPKMPRSKDVVVGEPRPCWASDGVNAPLLGAPPPPLLPPPPPWDAMLDVDAEVAKFEAGNGVVVRDLGDETAWFDWSCWDPVWRGVYGEADEEAEEEALRLGFRRFAELRTEENVEPKGEAVVGLSAELFEEPGLRTEGSSEEGGTLVVNGVRPRRELDCPVSPQADCLGLADPVFDDLGSLEAIEFWGAGWRGGKLI
jgi:hypothetical protein